MWEELFPPESLCCNTWPYMENSLELIKSKLRAYFISLVRACCLSYWCKCEKRPTFFCTDMRCGTFSFASFFAIFFCSFSSSAWTLDSTRISPLAAFKINTTRSYFKFHVIQRGGGGGGCGFFRGRGLSRGCTHPPTMETIPKDT